MKTLKMMRKLMMTVALVAAVFAASANEWTDSATGLTWSYDVVGVCATTDGFRFARRLSMTGISRPPFRRIGISTSSCQ